MTPVAALIFATTLLTVSTTDLRYRRIPNRILAVAALLALLIAAGPGGSELSAALFAAVVTSAPLFAAALLKPAGMGMGDAKLVAVIGLFLGWQAVPALLLGLALAGMTGVMISLGKRIPPSRTSLPLAPFLAVAAIPIALSGMQALQ